MQSVTRTLALSILAGCAAAPTPVSAPKSPLIDIASIEPGIVVDIRYATADNFLKAAVYPVNRCLLVPETAQRLIAFNPIFYLIDGFRYGVTGEAAADLRLSVGVAIAINAGLFAWAHYWFRTGYRLKS